METVVANVSGKARRETKGGRDYYVANATLIVPGVLAGSRGPIYYSPEETGRRPSDWDGMPLVIRHPVVNGNHVSARDPDVAEAYESGRNFRTKFTGKLASEMWFDIEQTRRVAPSVLNALASGRKIELSTGVFVDMEPAPEGATFNGRAYAFVARNLRPDHIAILPDAVGACSLADGCGVNNEGDPITTDGGDPPDTDRGTEMSTKLNADDRTRIIDSLVANCECADGRTLPWKGRDKSALNALSDETLQAWEDVRKALAANVSPAIATPANDPPSPPPLMFWNPERRVYEAVLVPSAVVPQGYHQPPVVNAAPPAAAPVAQTVPVATPAAPAKPKSMEDWLALMPAEAQPVWNSVMEAHARMKADLVERLVENFGGEAKEQARGIYAKMQQPELEQLVAALPPRQSQEPPAKPVYNWLGSAGAPSNAPIHEEPLPTPKYDFANRN